MNIHHQGVSSHESYYDVACAPKPDIWYLRIVVAVDVCVCVHVERGEALDVCIRDSTRFVLFLFFLLFCFFISILSIIYINVFFFSLYRDYEWQKFAHSVENCHTPRWSGRMSVWEVCQPEGGKWNKLAPVFFFSYVSPAAHGMYVCWPLQRSDRRPFSQKDPSLIQNSCLFFPLASFFKTSV